MSTASRARRRSWAPGSPHRRQRRRRSAALAAVVVVIVSVVVAAVAVAAVMVRAPGRTDSALSATADTSTAPTNPFDNSSLTPPIALDLPSWTSHASASGWFGAVDFDVGSCAVSGGSPPAPRTRTSSCDCCQ